MSVHCINSTLSVCSEFIKYCNIKCNTNECYCSCIGDDVNRRLKCYNYNLAIELIPLYIVGPFLLFIIAFIWNTIKKMKTQNQNVTVISNSNSNTDEDLLRPPPYNKINDQSDNELPTYSNHNNPT